MFIGLSQFVPRLACKGFTDGIKHDTSHDPCKFVIRLIRSILGYFISVNKGKMFTPLVPRLYNLMNKF